MNTSKMQRVATANLTKHNLLSFLSISDNGECNAGVLHPCSSVMFLYTDQHKKSVGAFSFSSKGHKA
jgi:hypothetical protein